MSYIQTLYTGTCTAAQWWAKRCRGWDDVFWNCTLQISNILISYTNISYIRTLYTGICTAAQWPARRCGGWDRVFWNFTSTAWAGNFTTWKQCSRYAFYYMQSTQVLRFETYCSGTRWQRPIGCLKMLVIFRKGATNYRALLRKLTNVYICIAT